MFLVTGANGFIGSVMVRELNARGIRDVIAVDHVTPEDRPGPLKQAEYSEFIVAQDLWKFLDNPRLASDIKCCFHMGACSTTTETNWDYLKENNFLYTQRLFSLCQKHNICLIYASSGAVYGDGSLGFDDRTDPERFLPLNLYGKSKVEFDRWVLGQQNTAHRWYGLRFFNVYGPNEYHKGEMSSVVYKAFHQIRQSGSLQLFKSHSANFKDGMQMRDFVYVKDISRWMWEIYQNPQFANGIYNQGSGLARTWMDLATSVFSAMDCPAKIQWIDIPSSIRNQYQYFTEANMKKSRDQGLSPAQWSLEEGVEDYVRNYLLLNESSL